jgi:hypothetical protein
LKAAAFCSAGDCRKFLGSLENSRSRSPHVFGNAGSNAQKNSQLVNNLAGNIIVFKFLE